MKNYRDLKPIAMYVAMVVRNEMEDFHAAHLSDKQMAELNPIIRNAIYTAMQSLDDLSKESPAAGVFVNFHTAMIPTYWEEPELTETYKSHMATWKFGESNQTSQKATPEQ